MDALATFNYIQTLQGAMQIMATLHLTAFLYPPDATVKDGEGFDFIIVGGGTAGCVIASRLAEDKSKTVLLVEAGGDPSSESSLPSLMIFLEKSHSDWNYSIEDDGKSQQYHKNRLTDLMLGRMLGGSSGLSYMLYSQGNKQDFETWADIISDKSWSWDNVSKYFQKSTTFENTLQKDSAYQNYKGPLIISKDQRPIIKEYLQVFQELGYSLADNLDAENSIGYTEQKYTIGKGYRQNTAFSHLRRVKEYPNLRVLKNSVVTKIQFDADKNAKGVEILVDNKNTITVTANKEIIISAGAINTAKLLMLSGIGPKEELGAHSINVISELPVGKNFQDQVAVVIIHDMTKMDRSPVPKSPHIYPCPVFTGYIALDGSNKPEYETTNYINTADYLMMYCTYTYGFVDEICNQLFANRGTNQMLWTMVTKLHPESRGSISLRSANAADPPIIHPGYFTKEADLESHLKYIKDFIRLDNTKAFKDMGGVWQDPKLEGCKGFKTDSDDYWKCYAQSLMTSQRHYSGTCSMGTVVDSKLLVKGVQKLRVADASVIPTTLSGDPMAAVVMIGEKAADLIKTEYGMSDGDM